jgi:hypothetical protein
VKTIQNEPTYRDADLLLKLYELRREVRLRQAREWFLASFHATTPEEFLEQCPPKSQEETWFRMVYSYWEMASSLVAAGILDEELFVHNNSEALLVWERIRPLVRDWRESWANPQTVKNLEVVAAKAADYLNRGNPDGHSTFVAKVC